ncbi:hypothetical protein OH687_17250 [Burkholderia anthina]|nr:hypothetical protein OH687_17250 [Burkholderia anthina]
MACHGVSPRSLRHSRKTGVPAAWRGALPGRHRYDGRRIRESTCGAHRATFFIVGDPARLARVGSPARAAAPFFRHGKSKSEMLGWAAPLRWLHSPHLVITS